MTYTDSIRIDRKLLSRIFSKIKISTEHFYNGIPCWEWTGAIGTKCGYARIYYKYHTLVASRFIYRLFVNSAIDNLQCDHLCRIRHCVNPAHLEAVTPKENTMRGDTPASKNAQKTHCPKGHPYSGDNLQIFCNTTRKSPMRMRACKTCRREVRAAKWAARSDEQKIEDAKQMHIYYKKRQSLSTLH